MIVQEDVPYTKEEVKAMVRTIHDLREKLSLMGWHPASELPPLNEDGESEYLIVYDLNGYTFSAFYSMKKGWCDDDGRNNLEIEWWCYPPKERGDYVLLY